MSVGLGQVRVNTARAIEEAGYIEAVTASYDELADVFYSENENRVLKLVVNESNVNYVAGYIRLIQDTWENEFAEISNRPDFLGTLYNLGHDFSSPHSSPGANDFGLYVQDNYEAMEYLLNK